MGTWASLFIGNLTYLLICCSYLVRDMLLLRVLAILASLCSVVFSLERGVYLIVFWNFVFILINVVQLSILLYERRPVHFTPEEEAIYEMVFRTLSRRDFKRLLDLAMWQTLEPQDVLVTEGTVIPELFVVLEGRAVVQAKGRIVGEVKEGYFVGEMSFLSDLPASANVEATLPMLVLAFPQAPLKDFLSTRPELRYGFQGVLGMDLTRKIRKADGLTTSAGTVPIEELTKQG